MSTVPPPRQDSLYWPFACPKAKDMASIEKRMFDEHPVFYAKVRLQGQAKSAPFHSPGEARSWAKTVEAVYSITDTCRRSRRYVRLLTTTERTYYKAPSANFYYGFLWAAGALCGAVGLLLHPDTGYAPEAMAVLSSGSHIVWSDAACSHDRAVPESGALPARMAYAYAAEKKYRSRWSRAIWHRSAWPRFV